METKKKLWCDCENMPGLHPINEDGCEGEGQLTSSPGHWVLAQTAMALMEAGDKEIKLEIEITSCGCFVNETVTVKEMIEKLKK